MHDAPPTRVLAFPGTVRPRPAKRWLAAGLVAAAAIGVVAVGINRTRGGAGPSDPPARGAPGSVLATTVGTRDSVRLSDGTEIILAPASRLAVSPTFGTTSREVSIEGMAWLSVHHDAALPFTVRAGRAIVRDVGTAFTIRTGGGAPDAVSVVVSEGRVDLRDASAPAAPAVLLSAGDRGELAGGQLTARRGGASDVDVAWTGGRLVFRDARLDVVRAELRRWYGVDLQIADSSLAGRRLTATFDGEPIDRVLQVMALALGAQVERRDSVAVLRAGTVR
jgi:transmembrane sensor